MLRSERVDDRVAVRDLHRAAFGAQGVVVADLVDDLRRAMRTDRDVAAVAEDHGQVVGHVMFTHCWLDAPRQLVDVQVLSPLAVRADQQGQGIGAALVRHGVQLMIDRDVPVVFLEGDPGYYSRLGFEAGIPQGFRKPSLRIPDPAFQAMRLPAHQPWMTGTLVYSETFWRHDAVGLRDD